MLINIDPDAGFCSGVSRVIRLADEELDRHGMLYSLGQVVHNEQEENRLKEKGLITIDHDCFSRLHNARVLIRAHGEPPDTYRIASENNLHLIDGTCPVVAGIQKKIRKVYNTQAVDGVQIVIFGKSDHPEVKGFNGQAGQQAIIIENRRDTGKIDPGKPVYLFAQTTMNPEDYDDIKAYLKEETGKPIDGDRPGFFPSKTICRQVMTRNQRLNRFAGEHDVVIFIAGKHSSNGKYLFTVVKSRNPRAYYISHPDELAGEWFEGVQKIGITGGTSTPVWLLEKTAEMIRNLK